MPDTITVTIDRADAGLLIAALLGTEKRALEAGATLAQNYPAIAEDARREAYGLARLRRLVLDALSPRAQPQTDRSGAVLRGDLRTPV